MNNSYMGSGISFYQHTLGARFHFLGQGLHTGARASVTVCPAEENTGYLFTRRDVHLANADIHARWYNVGGARLSTSVANHEGVRVSGIEHLLAALQGCGVDNAHIKIDGPEVPVLDGSCLIFVDFIKQAGLRRQTAPRRALLVEHSLAVGDGKRSAALYPAVVPSMRMALDVPSRAAGIQCFSLSLTPQSFRKDLAAARNFALLERLQRERDEGMQQGASLRNTLVLAHDRVMNKEGPRFGNECVRHACVDAIGDLALAGAMVIGQYDGQNACHALNNRLLREMMVKRNLVRNVSLEEADSWWRERYTAEEGRRAVNV